MKPNYFIGGVVAICSVLMGLSVYFNFCMKAMFVVSVLVEALTCFIVMMQTVNYNGHFDSHKEIPFWFAFSCVGGLIGVGTFYFLGFGIISQHLATAIIYGSGFIAYPCIAIFIGNVWRILKGEESAF